MTSSSDTVRGLTVENFTVKVEAMNRRRTGRREVLNKSETGEILREFTRFFKN